MMHALFFWTAKLLWPVLSPDSFLLLLLVVAWLAPRLGAHRFARRLLTLLVAACVVIALLPVGQWLLAPLENRFPTNPKLPARVDGIIVLSGAEDAARSSLWDQPELNGGAERDLAFMALARRYPTARLVFSGGSGSMVDQQDKAADVACRLFREQGLDTGRIIFERESRNTFENALRSKQLIRPAAGENWLLITSAWHMPRAVGIFRNLGWPVIPYPVDHATEPGRLLRPDLAFADHLRGLVAGTKEWLGLLAYRALGRTTTLLPAAQAPVAETRGRDCIAFLGTIGYKALCG